MIARLIALLAAAFVSAASLAQAHAQPEPPAARVELAHGVFKAMRFDVMWDQMVPTMIDSMMPLMQPTLAKANVRPDKMSEVTAILRRQMVAEFTSAEFRREYQRLGALEFAREFDDEDLKALIVFYESPPGRRILDKQPLLMQRIGTAGQQLGLRAGQRAGAATFHEAVLSGMIDIVPPK